MSQQNKAENSNSIKSIMHDKTVQKEVKKHDKQMDCQPNSILHRFSSESFYIVPFVWAICNFKDSHQFKRMSQKWTLA